MGGEGLAGVIGHFSDLSYWHATPKLRHIFGFRLFQNFFQPKKWPFPGQITLKLSLKNSVKHYKKDICRQWKLFCYGPLPSKVYQTLQDELSKTRPLLGYIALQGTRQESLPQVKLGDSLNLRLFGVCFWQKNKGRSWKLVKNPSIKQLRKKKIPKDNLKRSRSKILILDLRAPTS